MKLVKYSLQQRLHQLIELILFGKILKTQPIESDNDAPAEVVMLLSQKDLIMAFCALKSLCFFSNRSFKITLIADDGCLKPRHIKRIRSFVRNVSLILNRDAISEQIIQYPMCREFLFDPDPTVSKLLGPLVHATKNKIILMDSDVCFFGYPRALLEWVDSDDEDCLFLPGATPRYVTEELTQAIASTFNLRPPILMPDTGLLLFHKRILDLDALEKIFSIQKQYGYTQWSKELYAYGVLIQRYGHYRPLPPEYMNGSWYEAICNHYLSRYHHIKHARLKIRGMVEYILFKESL
ncbi:MAG: hypothetical protein DRG83_06430 [Deltaproteobacteria bacterium]|nr:MAG: hypothetical protein DRG83_06430 [Deltaproteobacteria bacterium]